MRQDKFIKLGIYHIAKKWEYLVMDIKNIRRQNLNRLIGEYIVEGYTKAQIAEKIGIPPSQLSQLSGSNASRNIGDIIARRIESSMGLPHGWMDSKRADVDASGTKPNFFINPLTKNQQQYRIEVLDTEFSCGSGRMNMDYPEIVKSIELDPEEAKRMFGGRSPTSLKICTVVGDSMLGTIFPGDLVVIDVTVNRLIGDGIYAFVYGDNFHIKRLQLLKDKLVVISDNSTYEKWFVSETDQSEFHIQGLVVGRWQMSYNRLG
ncbi:MULTISPECIES: S24 family peptidase [Enterobacteriaceae]|nr:MULTISPECIES: S24 family peptidase [Enterobacteriaceae]MCL5501807.1 helix-turn-helix transcriptional regulator [Escherichia coli]MDR7942463.1 S24 family peptidase [Enterobacter soli]EGK59598.1 transcriptional activator-regulatory protein [Enterobacter hormaechei ATCC 49162]MCC2874435.1 helix-turn-helix transcriptional regulator [Enterobacter asburiae]MCK1018238.1 helix-turn-helix transcriptional regulator [Enterobacter asburiae]